MRSAAAVRNQYTITYRPTNTKRDGTYRKLKVELVQPGTDKPLIVKDQKGKELKYQVLTREGYTAKHEVDELQASAVGVNSGPSAVVNGGVAGAGYAAALGQPGSQILDLVAGFGFGQFQGRGVAPGD